MRWTPAAVAFVAVAGAGCFGMCGPTVSSVDATGSLPAVLVDHQDQVRQVLAAAGFSVVNDVAGFLSMENATQTIVLSNEGNTTTYWTMIAVPDREFDDSAAGHRRADAYGEAQVARVRPAADSLFASIAQAMGVPGTPPADLAHSVAVC